MQYYRGTTMKNFIQILRCFISGLLVAAMICSSEACDVKSYEQRCLSCEDSLVGSWRSNPQGNCSVQYLAHKECISRHEATCLATPGMTNDTAKRIRFLSRVFTATKSFFCEDGIFDDLRHRKRTVSRVCSQKLFKRAEKCGRQFYQKFRNNRASKTLCRRYSKAKQCMVVAIQKYCIRSRVYDIMLRNYQKQHNPYCSDKVDRFRSYKPGGYGRCTRQGYISENRECTRNFVRSLQRNNGKNCRALVISHLLPCQKTRIKRCLKGGPRDDKTLVKAIEKRYDARRRHHLQNVFCEGGFLPTLRLRAEECRAEYFENFQGKCYSQFRNKFIQNRGDPKLCQYFDEAKRCARNMTLSLCTVNKVLKSAVFFLYGEFNPFCADGKDPTIHKKRAVDHDQSETTFESSSIAHAGSVITLILSISIAALLS